MQEPIDFTIIEFCLKLMLLNLDHEELSLTIYRAENRWKKMLLYFRPQSPYSVEHGFEVHGEPHMASWQTPLP